MRVNRVGQVLRTSVLVACIGPMLAALVSHSRALAIQQDPTGKQLFERVKATYGTVLSVRWARSVDHVAAQLAEVSSPDGDSYRTAILKAPGEFNAFALEGGYILLTSGSLELFEAVLEERGHVLGTGTYEEVFEGLVAGLLSHEIAHALLGHHEQSRLARGQMRGDSLALTRLAYERRLEFEADRVGALLMVRAGYALDGLYALFRIANALVEDPHALENLTYLQTHPRPSDREANLDIWKGQLKLNQARVDDAVTLIQNNTMLDVAVALLDSALIQFPRMLTLRHDRATAWHRIWLNSRPIGPSTPMGAFALYAPDILSMLRSEGGNRQALDNAISDYSYVVERTSTPTTLSQLAVLLAGAGSIEKAEELSSQALRESDNNPIVLANAAAVDLFMQRPESAYGRAQRVLAAVGSEEESVSRSAAGAALYNFALAAEQLGRKAEADEAYQLYVSRVDSTSRYARLVTARQGGAPAAGLPFLEVADQTIEISGLTPGSNERAVTANLGEPEFTLPAGRAASLVYPSKGLTVFLLDGLCSLFVARPGYDEPIHGIHIGDPLSDVQGRLGPAATVTPAGWHDYVNLGMSVHTENDRVVAIVVSG